MEDQEKSNEKSNENSDDKKLLPNYYVYCDEETKREVDMEFGSIHSVKGRTHLATLVLETFMKSHNMKSILDYLCGEPPKRMKSSSEKRLPHDTGMVTLAGTQNLNEFELHLRAVLGLPIPGIKQERIGASAVILSPIASQERPQYRGMEEVTKEEDTYLRIFGKPFTRVNRRMGVVLCYAPLNSELDALRDKAKRIAEKVEVY